MKIEEKLMNKKTVTAACLFILCGQLLWRAGSDMKGNFPSIRKQLYESLAVQSLTLYNPLLLYADSGWQESTPKDYIGRIVREHMPLYQYFEDNTAYTFDTESKSIYDGILFLESNDEEVVAGSQLTEETAGKVQEAAPGVKEEGESVQNAELTETLPPQEEWFVPNAVKSITYAPEQLRDIEFVKKTFYTEDPTTKITQQQLSYDYLLGYDVTLKQDNTKPQILIYHTHSQEGYVDSLPGDAATSVVGVGEYLSALLRNEYGFQVIHHMGQYDVQSRDYAYANAAKGLEAVLSENPSIEIMIDLHRDAVKEGTKLVTDVQGRETAQFMFFNGLSYTRERGEITSLPNAYIHENLSFAFQMQLAAQEYYPGLTRKIYLKGYRYNMHYRPKSLLVELGAQTNTVGEAMNACKPLAHLIAMVLNGDTKR